MKFANKSICRSVIRCACLLLFPFVVFAECADILPPEDRVLNYHLMHPGGNSTPADPNAAFYLDGTYHLHYILGHAWRGQKSWSFVHVTSPDMLHWTWQPTVLQPAFTGHGMFSGTGFITREGLPAIIYHGQGSGRNQVVIAKNNRLSGWQPPYPVEVKNQDGSPATMRHWDPDCFLVGDTYYAISGGGNPPLFKSKDLKSWTYVGDFLHHDLPDVVIGEDISCPHFFKLGDQWVLLCISHALGCRYYVGDWDAAAEQFIPRRHGRMNWRRDNQSLFGTASWRVDFFAPESVLTPDGRRVMWAWLASLGHEDGKMDERSIQSLPRELSLSKNGELRMRPIRELAALRRDPQIMTQLSLNPPVASLFADKAPSGAKIASIGEDAFEIRVTIDRKQVDRRIFGFVLFADGKGGGLPVIVRPDAGTLRVGRTEAPFSVQDLEAGEDFELRIFADKYLVEVFASDRQALVASDETYKAGSDFTGFVVGTPHGGAKDPLVIKKLEIWRLEPSHEGFKAAQKSHVWEPEIK